MIRYQTEFTNQELAGQVYRIKIDQLEKRNALNPAVYREIKEGVLRASGSDEARIILIEGHPGSFAVGGDLKLLLEITKLPPAERTLAYSQAYDEPLPFQSILDSPKVVVAKIDGLCLAGGLVLASVADIAIASENATFGVPEGLVGLADPFCSSLLPLTVGLSRARYLMLTAKRIDAATALDWGILQQVVTRDALEQATAELIADILKVSPLAQAAYKESSNAFVPRMNGLKVCDVAFTAIGQEGLQAFSDKRPARWR
jgi:enoyl-CoA hydratase